MHVSHRPFFPVWTPAAPTPNPSRELAEFIEIAQIAEDLCEDGKPGHHNRRQRQTRSPQPEHEQATFAAAELSTQEAKWSPGLCMRFHLTIIEATGSEPSDASLKDTEGPINTDPPIDEPSLEILLSRIVSAG